MKNTIKAVALGLSLLLANVCVSYAQDFQKGFAAYEKEDYATALKEWRPLADQGDAEAQFYLGRIYNKGQGVTQDYKEAARLYGLAAAQGYASAQYNLGLMYFNGQGVTQDYKEAARLYGLAAAQGDADAQVNLGGMYFNGEGVIQDKVSAHMWFNIAASMCCTYTSRGVADAVKNRDIIAKTMTASQLEKAQDLARECVKKNYKGC